MAPARSPRTKANFGAGPADMPLAQGRGPFDDEDDVGPVVGLRDERARQKSGERGEKGREFHG